MRRFPMFRLSFLIAVAAFVAGLGGADAATNPACRPAYIVPYSEQCDFAHAGVKKDRSPKNVADAYETCDRAQDQAGNCLTSPVKQVHVVALSALYRAVSQQADIAMFAGQYKTAEALLHEKLNVLNIVAKEGKPNDATVATERTQAKADLATTTSGECTERAYLSSAPARAFAHDHRYSDLEKTLVGESAQYTDCAHLAATPTRKAYVEYISLVAIEEAGRAAQAANDTDDANKLFNVCLKGTARSVRYAASDTKRYLTVLTTLCKGRMDGTYRVDQPRPLDQEGGAFRPLALPTK
jgi:hypothetical protein